MTGFSKEQTSKLGWLDAIWLDALHREDRAPTIKLVGESLETAKLIDIEYRGWAVDGGRKWMRSRGSPRYGASGEIIRWYGSVEDIDAAKRERQSLLQILEHF